jgi:hypothetical protein
MPALKQIYAAYAIDVFKAPEANPPSFTEAERKCYLPMAKY